MANKLERTVGKEAMFLGICGGVSKYFEVDPTIIRIAFALVTVFSFGGLILAYFIMAFIIPKENII